MSQKPLVTIGNAQAFWGDDPDAAVRLLSEFPQLDYLTLDYLSELSLSIMAIQKEKDPNRGYAADFVEVISKLVPFWNAGAKVKVVSNAGGLNPIECANACVKALVKAGCSRHLKIGVVSGDDVLPLLVASHDADAFQNLDDGEPLKVVQSQLATANAYMGAKGIVEALSKGADIVVTGRTADPSLTVGPCVHHYSWSWDDYERIAGATVAGHLLECGTQVTGGISTDWLLLDQPYLIGFPVAEVDRDGRCIITKAPETGGTVTEETVKEQLLYEIGDPNNYLSPDATVSFTNLRVKEIAKDRVLVEGAKGKAPPPTLKVNATYRAGFKSEAYLTLFGANAVLKAEKSAESLRKKLELAHCLPEKFHFECLGTGACVPGISSVPSEALIECVLRLSVQDKDERKLDRFSKEIASLVTCGPQGVTGYTGGRPSVRPVFGYWPCLIDAKHVQPTVHIIESS